MWIGFFLTLFICVIASIIIISITWDNEFEFNKMDCSEFRYKVLKEKPDEEIYNSWYHDNRYIFNSHITEEGVDKYNAYCDKIEKKSKVMNIFLHLLPIIVSIIIIALSSWLGAFIEKQDLNREIASYQASKYTIEMSLESDKLTGLERIELVKQASEKNAWLAQKQYEVNQWYRFYLDKDEILKLNFINLGEVNSE